MTIITSNRVELIPVQDLRVHERNVRKDVGDLAELTASIKAQGILEEIRGTNRLKGYGTSGTPLGTNNAATITQLVNAHFGVKATKKAKR